MSQLWVKRASASLTRRVTVHEKMARMFPMPFEERRSRVGMAPYRTFRWLRLVPFVIVPVVTCMTVAEARGNPHENIFTPLHLLLADHGIFAHDSIKALDPAFEHERRADEVRVNDLGWMCTGLDYLNAREQREFAAINYSKQQRLS